MILRKTTWSFWNGRKTYELYWRKNKSGHVRKGDTDKLERFLKSIRGRKVVVEVGE